MDSTSAIAVPVLGMHRSGTSMVSRVLEAGGVAFGATEGLAGPAGDNQHGYWENLEIRQINEELLRRLGGDWRNPPGLDLSSFSAIESEDLRQQAMVCLEKLAATSKPCWSMKDPRMCLLLPFWQPLLPSPHRAVLCLRHPAAIADSLQKRNRISPQLAGFLWQEYTAATCLALENSEVFVISYESMMSHPQREVQRFAEFFAGMGVSLNVEAMLEGVDPSLNHATLSSATFSEWHAGGSALYQQLLQCAAGEIPWSEVDATKPPRDPGFCALMQESALLAEELDLKSNAYGDRIQEVIEARLEKIASEQRLASEVSMREAVEAELEDKCRRMDNLQGRLEVRLGHALRKTFRRPTEES